MKNLSSQPETRGVLSSGLLAALGIEHGFSTAQAGIPAGGDLNHALPVFLQAAAITAPAGHLPLRQVHGATVHQAAPECSRNPPPEADAAVSAVPGLALVVRTADCVPVLLADRQAGVVAAAHAGWRGALAGVVEATLAAMSRLGAVAERTRAAIGPAIDPCCFEVSPEIAAAFADLAPDLVDHRRRGPHVDLPGTVRHTLQAAGVPARAIERRGGCTRCSGQRYFSYRRQGEQAGRLLSVIAAP